MCSTAVTVIQFYHTAFCIHILLFNEVYMTIMIGTVISCQINMHEITVIINYVCVVVVLIKKYCVYASRSV